MHARHSVAEAGDQSCGARDVATRFADRIDATKDNIVDQRRIELVAVLHGRERLRREIEGRHLVQRSISLAAPARSADGVVDKCVGHFLAPSLSLRERD